LTPNAVCFRRQVASITGFIRHCACPGPGNWPQKRLHLAQK